MAIVCKEQEQVYSTNNKLRRCLLLADETPLELPTNGVGIDNIEDDVVLDGGSILLALDTSTRYVLGNDKQTWFKWKP